MDRSFGAPVVSAGADAAATRRGRSTVNTLRISWTHLDTTILVNLDKHAGETCPQYLKRISHGNISWTVVISILVLSVVGTVVRPNDNQHAERRK